MHTCESLGLSVSIRAIRAQSARRENTFHLTAPTSPPPLAASHKTHVASFQSHHQRILCHIIPCCDDNNDGKDCARYVEITVVETPNLSRFQYPVTLPNPPPSPHPTPYTCTLARSSHIANTKHRRRVKTIPSFCTGGRVSLAKLYSTHSVQNSPSTPPPSPTF